MTEAFHYPGYVIRLQKRRQIQAKTKNLHEKFCRKTMSPNQLISKLITKNNKNLRFQVTTFVSHMTPIIVIRKNLQKGGNVVKITKNGFTKTSCSQKKDRLRKIKPLWRANWISKDKWYELYIEMLSYDLVEIKLADLKNLYLFLLKTSIFKVHSQQKLSTKRVDILSCNYSEN